MVFVMLCSVPSWFCLLFAQIKYLRGGGGRRSHDEAQPWGGSGLRVETTAPSSPAVSSAGPLFCVDLDSVCYPLGCNNYTK